MAQLKEITDYLASTLQITEINDYCPNGLQVEGRSEINHIVAGVTASQSLIEAAIADNADAILVHHGYFWKGETQTITGIKQKRIKALLAADINLLAYHLPLDVHQSYGNNAQLAKQLEIEVTAMHSLNGVKQLLWQGRLKKPMSAQNWQQNISEALGREALHIESGQAQMIQNVAWCTGGAQNYLQQAADLGVDAYLSGEISEQTFHLAKELGVHYYSAGHHATERYGVQALAAHLEQKFGISSRYIDIDNPV